MPERSWRRVCVDLDRLDQPIGWSVEWHEGDEQVEVYTFGPVGPFDSASNAFLSAVTAERVQRRLWPRSSGSVLGPDTQ